MFSEFLVVAGHAPASPALVLPVRLHSRVFVRSARHVLALALPHGFRYALPRSSRVLVRCRCVVFAECVGSCPCHFLAMSLLPPAAHALHCWPGGGTVLRRFLPFVSASCFCRLAMSSTRSGPVLSLSLVASRVVAHMLGHLELPLAPAVAGVSLHLRACHTTVLAKSIGATAGLPPYTYTEPFHVEALHVSRPQASQVQVGRRPRPPE